MSYPIKVGASYLFQDPLTHNCGGRAPQTKQELVTVVEHTPEEWQEDRYTVVDSRGRIGMAFSADLIPIKGK